MYIHHEEDKEPVLHVSQERYDQLSKLTNHKLEAVPMLETPRVIWNQEKQLFEPSKKTNKNLYIK